MPLATKWVDIIKYFLCLQNYSTNDKNYSERVQGSTPNTWPNLDEIRPVTDADTHTCADMDSTDSTDAKL